MKVTIGVDVDDVLRDLRNQVHFIYNIAYPDHKYEWDGQFLFHEYLPIGKDIYKFIWEDYVQEILSQAKPIPGAIEFIHLLKRRGYNVAIITDQPTLQAKIYTFNWLVEYGFMEMVDHVCILDGGTCFGKHSISVDALVDDYKKNLHNCAIKQILPICYAQPWNKDEPNRFSSFDQLLGFIYDHLPTKSKV